MNYSNDFFQPNMKDNKMFYLEYKVPWFFEYKNRLLVANDKYMEFAENIHKATAFQDVV